MRVRTATWTLLILALAPRAGLAQFGGNINYGQAGGRAKAEAEANERAKKVVTREEMPPSNSAMFVEANVLMNVKADEFVALFGVAEEAETIEGCQKQMDATVAAFREAIQPLGIPDDAVHVDFTAQTKVYGFEVEGTVATERVTGFELKKTIAIRFRDKAMIDRLVIAASRAKIYDLIKVDYVVTDLEPIQEKLAELASTVIKAKADRHERLLGIKLRAVPQVFIERSAAYYPTEMYDSYTSGETEEVSGGPDRSRLTVRSLRKSRTFYFHPLEANGFDRIIEPVVLEPIVQFTYYLKLRYEIETRN